MSIFRNLNGNYINKGLRDVPSKLTVSNTKVWLEHYERLLSVEFELDPEHPSYEHHLKDHQSQ